MSPKCRRRRMKLPDVQHDSIIKMSQKLSFDKLMREDVAACLQNQDTDFDFGEVESLVREVELKAEELNRISKDLLRAIRKKQESCRSLSTGEDVDRKERCPRGSGPPCQETGPRIRQRQVALTKQKLLRTCSGKHCDNIIKPDIRSGSMRKSEPGSQSSSPKTIETAPLVQGSGPPDNQDTGATRPEKFASSLVKGPTGMAKIIACDEENHDNAYWSMQMNSQKDEHDAFNRELVQIFNESIGGDPGGPSGFLGTIDAPPMPDGDFEGDIATQDGSEIHSNKNRDTDDEAIIIIESDSDLQESPIEISSEGPPEELDQMTKGATVALGFADDTLDRLRPGVQLNDTTILDVLKTMLPETAEPLIARWAIMNFPISGLVRGFIPTSRPPPMLRHKITSTHLFLIYNVVFGTLDCDLQGNGNHWILIIIDFTGPQVHIFGTESNLELRADLLASNIGTMVNNYRAYRGEDVVCWSKPQHHPLYPHGTVPDDYNCGICVIHRAETFINPVKALHVPEETTPAALSEQLNQLRNQYRTFFLREYGSLCAEKALQAQILSSIPRKRPFMTDSFAKDRASQSIRIHRSSLQVQPVSPGMEHSLAASEEWKACLFRCAESKGFAGEHIIKVFEKAPTSDVASVLRAIQCMCEVANANILLRLKKVLASENEALLRESWSSEPDTLVEIARLHHAIGWLDDVDPYLSTFKTSCCQISYHKSFQRRVDRLSKNLKEGRKRRKKIKSKKFGDTREQIGHHPQDNSNARKRVIAEVVGLIDPKEVDRAGVEDAVKRYEKAGRILSLLKECRNPFWLLLYPLYDNGPTSFEVVRQPSLNVMDFEPPQAIDRLRRPISRADLVDMTRQIAKYFGSSLFAARPELQDITLNRENGQFDSEIQISTKSDEEIEMTRPKDVARLFKYPTS
ncbi:hypothetical protein B0J12DRAFT_703745 [Macrophomina phaseolina]|uniref:Ubiquitin-like protease family profile domain-containing protein n=1 Tax=Macrophomina phaseolina TaxID=35725 RepID=A0ABQ8FXH4_9PEZI|nr:hypothetical protein B0J12DRAFT_703745 [Macrophomina phaseolina]